MRFCLQLIAYSLQLTCFFLGLSGCQSEKLYRDNRVLMGTYIEVTSPSPEAAGIVFAEFKRLEDLLSKYKLESEISQLNRLGKLKVSPETFYVIKKSKEFWQQAKGAFDITVAPLMDLWGFTDKKYRLPKEKEIKVTLKLVGSQNIILQEENNVVEFRLSGMKIDLGAIAKGYALDSSVEKLKIVGIASCLINAGGQVYALGDKPRPSFWSLLGWKEGRGLSGKPWKVAIQNPRGKNITDYIELKDRGAATSGDYEQYFIKDNRRYGHIFNPRTGYPAETKISSVTVITSSGLNADAIATTLFILDKKEWAAFLSCFPDTKIKIKEAP